MLDLIFKAFLNLAYKINLAKCVVRQILCEFAGALFQSFMQNAYEAKRGESNSLYKILNSVWL